MILRKLTADDEAAFYNSLKLWSERDIKLWYASEWKGSYRLFIEKLKNNSFGIDLKKDFVPCSTFYAFIDKETIVGRLSLRHELNEKLLIYGGNIGYAVAEKYRGCGYATEMVKQSLTSAKKIGINKILFTCKDDNVASYRVIEKCGGALKDIVKDFEHDRRSRRYWIEL